jgi:hypothetical protein
MTVTLEMYVMVWLQLSIVSARAMCYLIVVLNFKVTVMVLTDCM